MFRVFIHSSSDINSIIEKSPVPLLYWRRYVDDVIAIVKNVTDATLLLEYLNGLKTQIAFTMEFATAVWNFYFLDLSIRLDNATFQTSVHVKSTNTELLCNWSSLSPSSHKVSIVQSLLRRSYTHSTTWSLFSDEVQRIKYLCSKNGYPTTLVDRLISSFVDSVVNGVTGSQIFTFWRLY